MQLFTELALYALDVYNQQQIVSHGYASKNDNEWIGNQYGGSNNYGSRIQNNVVTPMYPPYYDYNYGQYRYFPNEWKDLDRIIQWIQTAYEM